MPASVPFIGSAHANESAILSGSSLQGLRGLLSCLCIDATSMFALIKSSLLCLALFSTLSFLLPLSAYLNGFIVLGIPPLQGGFDNEAISY